MTRHHHRAAAPLSCERENLVRDGRFAGGAAESGFERAGAQSRTAQQLGRAVDQAPGPFLLFGNPDLPFGRETCRESVLRLGISRAAVFKQAGRELRQDVGDADAKPPMPTQEPSDIGDRTLVRGRLSENEEKAPFARAALAPTWGFGGGAIPVVDFSS